MTDYKYVRKQQEDLGVICSNYPILITKEEGIHMLCEALGHLYNFAETLTDDSRDLILSSLGTDPTEWLKKTELELIEDQEDAICDTWVYMLNVATQFGLNIITFNEGSDDYKRVKIFTEATGTKCSEHPVAINMDRGTFLLKHALSELHEFALTITNSTDEAHALLKDCFDVCTLKAVSDRKDSTQPRDEKETLQRQKEAIIGTWVSMLKTAVKHGQDVSSMMNVVMTSNMAKIDPVTGRCIRRESDGKILKPDGWMPPDTKKEIERQIREGTF